MQQKRFTIIGAGIVGVSAAFYLQRAGHQVTLIDMAGPGEGASRGNAAVIATESCIPVATPGIFRRVPGMLLDPLGPLAIRWPYFPRIAPWLLRFLAASTPARVETISIALRAILVRALAEHRLLAAAAGAAEMIRQTGWLAVYETDRSFAQAHWALDLQARRGVSFELLADGAIRDFEPSLAPIYRHAVYYPENAFVTDNYLFVQKIAALVASQGGTLVKARVRGFDFDASGVSHVLTEDGRHATDAVVVAAGAWSKPLAGALGHRVPLDTERGYHVTLPSPGKMPRMPIYSGDHSFAITPLSVGLRFAGTVELGGLQAPPNTARAAILLKHGRRMFGALNETGRSDWMGFRPSLPDSLPVIDRGRRFANSFFAFGHGHLGLTLGPVSGRLVADLALGRDPGIDLAPFRIDRF